MKAPRYAVGLTIAALMLLSLALVTGCGKKEFKITETKLVAEIDDQGQPVGEDLSTDTSVNAEQKGIYLWFKYPRLSKPLKVRGHVTLTEENGNKLELQRELELERGHKVGYFGIKLDPGEPLPAGEYEMALKTSAGEDLLKDPSDPKKAAPVKFTVQ